MAFPIDIAVDEELCSGCGACAASCPCDAVEILDGVAVIDDQCMRCTACVRLCPMQALSVRRRPPSVPLRDGPLPAPRREPPAWR